MPIQVLHWIIHNITTTDSHDSDNNDNDSDEDCKNPKPNSTNEQETTNNNDDNANNGNSGQHYHWNDIGAINDYISITDWQDSISSLTTETASLTVFVHELFQMKNSLQTMMNLVGMEKLLLSSMRNVMFQWHFNNSSGEGYLQKYKSIR